MIPGYLTGQVRDRPQIGDYAWRARTYPHAVRALQRANDRAARQAAIERDLAELIGVLAALMAHDRNETR